MAKKVQILVVNDDLHVRKAIVRLVKPLCDEVFETDSGVQALELVLNRRPDLVLLDRILPDIEGTEICRRIKEDERTAHVFVALLSASKVTEDHRADGLELGADDYLIWPMNHREFTARVRAMLRLRVAERQLRESREQYRQIVETALEGVWMTDPEGVTTFVNPQMAAMLGSDVQDIVGRPFVDFLDEDVRERFQQQIAPCLMRERIRLELPLRRKDGATVWGLVSSTPFLAEDGQLLACLKMVTDITGLKQAGEERERLIQELEASLAQVKRLSGLIPICMSCKKIRDDQGYWQNLEKFLHENADIVFSHGLCPDCARRLYPGYFDEEEQSTADSPRSMGDLSVAR